MLRRLGRGENPYSVDYNLERSFSIHYYEIYQYTICNFDKYNDK